MVNERVIKFPVPEWKRVIHSEMNAMAYCLCYQYDINTSGYGPYGFNTIKANTFISSIFNELQLFRYEDIKLQPVDNIIQNGLYFFNNTSAAEVAVNELIKYYSAIKKNKLLEKKGLSITPIDVTPALLNLISDKVYNNVGIQYLIDSNIDFFIKTTYSPEAGDSLILFDEKIVPTTKEFCIKENINFSEVSSINELLSW